MITLMVSTVIQEFIRPDLNKYTHSGYPIAGLITKKVLLSLLSLFFPLAGKSSIFF